MELNEWLATPFEEGRWHRLSEWLDTAGDVETVDALLSRIGEWPEQHRAAVKEWNHNELGGHALRELLLWHWLAVPSKQHLMRLVSAVRVFGPAAAKGVQAELAEVSQHLQLEALSLRNCEMAGSDLDAFLQASDSHDTLSYLELRGNSLQTADLQLLEALPALRHLDLRVNRELWNRPSLGRLPSGVDSILLENTGLDDMAMRAIGGSYPNLEVLGLSDNVFTDSGVEEFFAASELPSLASVYFGHANVTARTLDVLVETSIAAQLDELMIVGADLSGVTEGVLPLFTSLHTVALIDCRLPPETAEEWLRSPAGERLEFVDLSSTE